MQIRSAVMLAGSLGAMLATSNPASAADLPSRMSAPMAPVAVAPMPMPFNWSGLYVGGHVGYGWGDFDFRNPTVTLSGPGAALLGAAGTASLPLERSFSGDSILGGAQVGVNAQWGNLVLGIEGDASWTDLQGSVRSTAGPFTLLGVGPFTTAEGASADLDFLGTVRGRLGVAFGGILVYGTGGVAFGRVSSTGDVTASLGPEFLSLRARGHETHVGWTAGAGVEAMLTSNLSAKVEYLYTDLGRETHQAPGLVTASPVAAALIPPGTSVAASGDFRVEVQTIKVGLNYRFGT